VPAFLVDDSFDAGKELCHNLTYLGKVGMRTIAGLSVAYLSGSSSVPGFEEAARILPKQLGPDGADIFLSAVWPTQVLKHVGAAQLTDAVTQASNSGDRAVSQAAGLIEPRYHFAGTGGVFFQRAPYSNVMSNATTRFISLGKVSQTAGAAKWIHALVLKPRAEMSPAELAATPAATTQSPYAAGSAQPAAAPPPAKRMKVAPAPPKPAAAPEQQAWRWSMPQDTGQHRKASGSRDNDAGPRPEGVKEIFVGNLSFKVDESELGSAFLRCGDIVSLNIAMDGGRSKGHGWIEFSTEQAADKAMEMDGFEIGGRPVRIGWGKGRGGGGGGHSSVPVACWFCLSNPQIEDHLIVSVGELTYVALAKGGLLPDHMLIVPIEHVPSASGMPIPVADEIEKYKQALNKLWTAEGRALVAYERHIVMRNAEHIHVQVLPVPTDVAPRVIPAFRNHPSSLIFEDGAGEVRPDGPGFSVEAAGQIAVHHKTANGNIPMQLGREVLADLLGMPERANWKQCALSKDEETRAAEAFKEAFSKYDPFVE